MLNLIERNFTNYKDILKSYVEEIQESVEENNDPGIIEWTNIIAEDLTTENGSQDNYIIIIE